MWNYLYFMMHIEKKPLTDLTAQERHFRSSLATGNEQKCFPINNALILSDLNVNKVFVFAVARITNPGNHMNCSISPYALN